MQNCFFSGKHLEDEFLISGLENWGYISNYISNILFRSTTDALTKPKLSLLPNKTNLCAVLADHFLVCVSFFGGRGKESSTKQ